MSYRLHPDATEPCHPDWCGSARVRAALQVAPRHARPTPDKPDPVRDLAKARARADKQADKEKP